MMARPVQSPPTLAAARWLLLAAVSVLPLAVATGCDKNDGQGPSQNSSGAANPNSGAPVDGNVRLAVAFPELDFDRPVDFQHPGDGTDRVFVLEQAGKIHVFENDRAVETTEVFLDIENKVSRQGNEEGLLGLAFPPDYPEESSFYIYYSAANPRRSILARYTVDPENPNRAVEDSESVLMEIPQPYSNHNGGQVSFGPDGYLYVALGDGGSGGDPQENGQNPKTLLASIIRIDVDNPSGGRPYGIPSDNPFAGNTEGYREEIYAYGLRNAWRFSWDTETGQLWTGDVGQNEYEEIDIVEKGKNYGWNIMEGSHCFDPPSGCDREGLELPIIDYPRDEGVSVTGGFVYRGQNVPALEGKYIYADYGTGTVWALSFDGKKATGNQVIAESGLGISSFGVDRHQELYACAFDGKIYKFVQ